jgi:hypothetical protein
MFIVQFINKSMITIVIYVLIKVTKKQFEWNSIIIET